MNSKTVTPAQDTFTFPVQPLAYDRPPRRFPWGRLVAVLLSLLVLPFLLTSSEGARLLMALTFSGILFFLIKRAPGVGLGASVAFLCLLGGLRRWLIPVYDWSGTDPLLLTSPIVVALALLTTRRVLPPTRLSRLLLALLVIMAAEVVNPLQGGLAIGLSGILFYVVPILWYFAVRQIGMSGVVEKIAQITIGVAVLGALYGFYQTYFGFNGAEQMWMKITSTAYVALHVGNRIRPFSFFTSAAEYALFLSTGTVLVWVYFLRGQRAVIVFLPLLIIALFLESVRGAMVTTLITCVILTAVQAKDPRVWVRRGVPLLVVSAGLIFFGLSHLNTAGMSADTQSLAEHTVSGLTDPTHSTAVYHSYQGVYGILHGFQNPIGSGLGVTTIAAQKFGASDQTTEGDISNMFYSLGFIGGSIFVAIYVLAMVMAFRYWHLARSTTALLILAVLVGGFGQWLNGGEYATCVLVWICIGALDRLTRDHERRAALEKAAATP